MTEVASVCYFGSNACVMSLGGDSRVGAGSLEAGLLAHVLLLVLGSI
jgi:hypothetical protein